MATEPLPQQLAAYKPSSAERDAYNYLFDRADTDQLGVLTGDRAVPFFSHSALPPLILGQVWQIADPDNIGFLSQDRFGVACRLIAHAQARQKTGAPRVDTDDVARPAPQPPAFKGHALPDRLAQPLHHQRAASTIHSPPASPAPASSPGAAPKQQQQPSASLNHISAADKANYARIFTSALGGPQHAGPTSLLDGDKAREIWIKSDLPFDVLGQIWALADTHNRGQLDLTDFTIGMHLLHLVLDGKLPSNAQGLPQVLDPALYKAAMSTLPPAAAAAGPTAPAANPPAASAPQNLSAQSFPSGSGSNNAGWVISTAEKQESDQWFDQLDSAHKGLLEGEQAVGFFGQSGLGIEVLAKIWDLSDLRNEGHLNKDTFAVAMHLVKRAVADPSTPLPDSLPQDLVPPSFRAASATGTSSAAPASGPQKDLLDLLDDDATAPGGFSLSPQSTGTLPPLPLSPQGTGATSRPSAPPLSPMHMRSLSPQLTGASHSGAAAVTSSGQNSLQAGASAMYPQLTGTSTIANAPMTPKVQTPLPTGSGSASGFESNFTPVGAAAGVMGGAAATLGAAAAMHSPKQQQQQQQTSSTFFDDNDDADLASNARSLQSQASTLRGEADSAEQQSKATGETRSELEKQVQAATAEISALQERVSRARATYEAEREKVEDLRARSKEQQDVLSRAKHELIRAESDLSALRMEKTEIEGELLRDKEDVRELKRKVALVEDEKRILAAEVDKLRKDVRQNRGLGAIARKQLASVEADRTKLEGEVEQLKSEKSRADGEADAGGVSGALAAGVAAVDAGIGAVALGEGGASGPASPTGSFHQQPHPDGVRAAALAATAPAAQAATVALPQTPGATAARTGTNPFERYMHRPAASSAASSPLTSPRGPLSPASPTGPSSTTNPFSAAAVAATRSPLASPPVPIKQEEQEPVVLVEAERSSVEAPETAEPAEKEKENDGLASLPLTAAAAVGTGAVAALSAVGAGLYEAVSGKAHHEDHPEVQKKEVEAAPQAIKKEEEATPDLTGEPDPFGVASTSPTTATPSGFDSGGFGDDFSTAPVSTAIATAEPKREDVPGLIVGRLGEIEPESGFTDAVRDVNGGAGPDAVQGTLGEVDRNAGFDEAFKEIEEHEHQPATADLNHGKPNEATRRDDDSSSSDEDDDEEGPEEAFGASPRYAAAGSTEDEPVTSTAASTAASVGDFGAGHGAAETPSVVAAEVAPSAEIAHREDDAEVSEPVKAKEREPTTNSSESGESFVHVPPASTVPAETPPSLAATPTPTSSSQRRAAPPPPVRAAAVDNGFADAAAPSTSTSTSLTTPPTADKAPEDDFDSAFADMGISSPSASTGVAAPATSAAEPATVVPDFDSFENDFDFQPSFDETSEAAVASQNARLASQVQSSVGGTTDFDDAAFADFDSTFAPGSDAPLNSSAPAPSASQAADQAFDAAFDDTFDESGAPVLGKPVGTFPDSAAPVITAAPTLAREESFAGEEEGVRTIRQMGFSREQALEALDKYDGDINRAVNSLVG
ncbi:hypothetical protein JCM3774_005053 [Rhodotorula dairenensis]